MSDYYGQGYDAEERRKQKDKGQGKYSQDDAVYDYGGEASSDEPANVRHSRTEGEATREAIRQAQIDSMGHLQEFIHRAPARGHTPIQGDVEIEDAPRKWGENDIEIGEGRKR